jgi:hypothetical protein
MIRPITHVDFYTTSIFSGYFFGLRVNASPFPTDSPYVFVRNFLSFICGTLFHVIKTSIDNLFPWRIHHFQLRLEVDEKY